MVNACQSHRQFERRAHDATPPHVRALITADDALDDGFSWVLIGAAHAGALIFISSTRRKVLLPRVTGARGDSGTLMHLEFLRRYRRSSRPHKMIDERWQKDIEHFWCFTATYFYARILMITSRRSRRAFHAAYRFPALARFLASDVPRSQYRLGHAFLSLISLVAAVWYSRFNLMTW